MKKEDLIKGLHEQKELAANEWRQAVSTYPTCEIILWHYLRQLYRDDDISFENELMRLGLRLSNKKGFYHFMTQKKNDYTFPELAATSGDWFAQEESRSQETKTSLLELARKLKASRLAEKEKREVAKATTEAKKEEIAPIEPTEVLYTQLDEYDKEMKIKDLINEKKYSEALEILRSINLSNSKKSATFAVQIRWLETIINYK